MKIGIMQPYFMPYIGYWQLIKEVDKFVLLDDVNYIVRGYINRNNILLNGEIYRFTIPVDKASQNKLIMDTKLKFGKQEKDRLLMTLRSAYHKAKYYSNVMPLMETIIYNQEDDLTRYIQFSIEKVKKYLNMTTPVLISSELEKDNGLKGEERIIEICKRLGADTYINPSGGRALYHHEHFLTENMKLYFIDMQVDQIIYRQCSNQFVQNLSIIDLLMNISVEEINLLLEKFQLNSK